MDRWMDVLWHTLIQNDWMRPFTQSLNRSLNAWAIFVDSVTYTVYGIIFSKLLKKCNSFQRQIFLKPQIILKLKWRHSLKSFPFHWSWFFLFFLSSMYSIKRTSITTADSFILEVTFKLTPKLYLFNHTLKFLWQIHFPIHFS